MLVTAGATEALAATVLALAGPGDEVLTLEPFYDSYAAVIALAGATHTTAPLRATADGFRLDLDALAAAFTPRTRLVLVNTPHNPTGTVLTRDELAAIARLAVEHDAIVVTDEVYEHLVLDGVGRRARADRDAARHGRAHADRSRRPARPSRSPAGRSAGSPGRSALVTAVRTVKQFLTYVNGAPFQPAIAFALRRPGRRRLGGRARRTRCPVVATCSAAGSRTRASRSSGRRAPTSCSPTPRRSGYADGAALCRDLPGLAGVVGVPVTAFTHAGSEVDAALRSWVRFTFVKRDEVLAQAVAGLHRLHRA